MSVPSLAELLQAFPDFELGNVSAGEALGLDRVLALLAEVGSPHLRLPVFHIAGTKGKGSTAAMIASITRAAGYRTGLFSSPHLLRINERFQVDGDALDDVILTTILAERVLPAVERLARRGITGVQNFEAQVALAFLAFEHREVDVVVLEVGLGGRLDGTNVVPQPLASTLTSIGFDHMAVLGNTLSLIAAEKAAIVKTGVPVVASPQVPEVEEVFIDRCRRMHATLYLGARDWDVTNIDVQLSGTRFDLRIAEPTLVRLVQDQAVAHSLASGPAALTDRSCLADWTDPSNQTDSATTVAGTPLMLRGLNTPLLGAHQAVNAATAALTALVAARTQRCIDLEAVRRGLAAVEWPGRLQIVDRHPSIVLDGAHTPESAVAVASAIRQLFPSQTVLLVCGIQADKDVASIARALGTLADRVVATRSYHRRAAPAEIIADAFRRAGNQRVEQREDPQDALALARTYARPDDVILVTGSLHLVGAVLAQYEAAARLPERLQSPPSLP